jgi:hypothetical protein
MLNAMMTVEEFQSEWGMLLKEYDVEPDGNPFLEQIYADAAVVVQRELGDGDEHFETRDEVGKDGLDDAYSPVSWVK